jgi:hypothetical protein
LILGSFSHGVSFSSKQAGQTEGRANLLDIHLDADSSFVYGAIALSAGIDVNAHQNAKSSM